MESTQVPINYFPIFMQFLLAIGFVVATMTGTHFLGPKKKTANKLDSFECGIEEKGNARNPFSVKYFLTAILFVLFDVEVIFMYPWAVNFRELQLPGFIDMLVFMSLLLIGFFYVIKRKALDWES